MSADTLTALIAEELQIPADQLDQPDAFGRVMKRYNQATPSERHGWRLQRGAVRQRERDREHSISLTMDELLARLGISRALAEHIVQPYCRCEPRSVGGWLFCDHACDLGLAGD